MVTRANTNRVETVSNNGMTIKNYYQTIKDREKLIKQERYDVGGELQGYTDYKISHGKTINKFIYTRNEDGTFDRVNKQSQRDLDRRSQERKPGDYLTEQEVRDTANHTEYRTVQDRIQPSTIEIEFLPTGGIKNFKEISKRLTPEQIEQVGRMQEEYMQDVNRAKASRSILNAKIGQALDLREKERIIDRQRESQGFYDLSPVSLPDGIILNEESILPKQKDNNLEVTYNDKISYTQVLDKLGTINNDNILSFPIGVAQRFQSYSPYTYMIPTDSSFIDTIYGTEKGFDILKTKDALVDVGKGMADISFELVYGNFMKEDSKIFPEIGKQLKDNTGVFFGQLAADIALGYGIDTVWGTTKKSSVTTKNPEIGISEALKDIKGQDIEFKSMFAEETFSRQGIPLDIKKIDQTFKEPLVEFKGKLYNSEGSVVGTESGFIKNGKKISTIELKDYLIRSDIFDEFAQIEVFKKTDKGLIPTKDIKFQIPDTAFPTRKTTIVNNAFEKSFSGKKKVGIDLIDGKYIYVDDPKNPFPYRKQLSQEFQSIEKGSRTTGTKQESLIVDQSQTSFTDATASDAFIKTQEIEFIPDGKIKLFEDQRFMQPQISFVDDIPYYREPTISSDYTIVDGNLRRKLVYDKPSNIETLSKQINQMNAKYRWQELDAEPIKKPSVKKVKVQKPNTQTVIFLRDFGWEYSKDFKLLTEEFLKSDIAKSELKIDSSMNKLIYEKPKGIKNIELFDDATLSTNKPTQQLARGSELLTDMELLQKQKSIVEVRRPIFEEIKTKGMSSILPELKSKFSMKMPDIISLNKVGLFGVGKLSMSDYLKEVSKPTLKLNGKLISDTKTKSKVDYLLKSKLITLTKNNMVQVPKNLLKYDTDLKLKTINDSVLTTKNLTPLFGFSGDGIDTVQRKPPKKKIPKIPSPDFPTIEATNDGNNYDVFVIERGKPKRVNKLPHTKRSAHGLGMDVIDNTPSATYYLKQSKNKAKPSNDFDKKFDTRKIYSKEKNKKRVFIEKSKFRIDTDGEIKGITVKGHMAQRKKALWRV